MHRSAAIGCPFRRLLQQRCAQKRDQIINRIEPPALRLFADRFHHKAKVVLLDISGVRVGETMSPQTPLCVR